VMWTMPAPPNAGVGHLFAHATRVEGKKAGAGKFQESLRF